MEEIAAVILAAGKGTRMKSSLAKVLHPLLGRPLLAYPLDACRAAGVRRIVAIVGHQAEEVEKQLSAPDVSFALQAEQKGTAHAAQCAREALQSVDGTALILCGDVPLLRPETLTALAETHGRSGALVTVLSMEPGDPKGYGRLIRNAEGRLLRIVEEKDASDEERRVGEVNTGTCAVELPWLWGVLAGLEAHNSQGEFYLTDIVEAAAREGRAASLLLADPDEVMGINSRTHLANAAQVLRRRINRAWMEAGVTLEDPETTWIEPGVRLAEDVTVGPGCRLEGDSSVGTGARIDQGTVMANSHVGSRTHIKPYCVLSRARVGDSASVGPFAHLRPDADVGDSAHVGNFVELKKARLGRGSKANHLTYLGDTEIGEGTNVGAGTITCNYDGEAKHRTVIGDRAFIGSNTSLVAPIKVGSDVTVAAGSVLTLDVPDGSLGVGRARQRNIAGWVVRKKVMSPKG